MEEKIKELHQAGKSIADIAKELVVHPGHVQHVINNG